MTAKHSKEAYDQWHLEHEVDVNATAVWHTKVKELADPERDFQQKRVLEIGCGRGGFACWLASQPYAPSEFVAADYSTSAVERGREFAKSLGLNAITWREADIQQIPFEDATFDTVISCETIEHVPEPSKSLRELVRVLKPGGRLFLTTPNYFNPFGIYRGYLRLMGRPYQEAGQPINKLIRDASAHSKLGPKVRNGRRTLRFS